MVTVVQVQEVGVRIQTVLTYRKKKEPFINFFQQKKKKKSFQNPQSTTVAYKQGF